MPNYTKRKDGRYQTRIYLGRDEYNKKIFKYLYADNPKILKKLETELRGKINKGIDILSIEDTFESWAMRLYDVRETELNEKEFATFKARCSYFSKQLGHIPLKDISQSNIQPLIKELSIRNPSTGKPSGKRTLERYLSAASQVFEYAIENRASDFNPCKYVRIPKQATTQQRRALTPYERTWIEETPHRAQTAAMLLMYSGLRRGEATALLWSDIDFETKTISVTKSYDFKECVLKTPKTAAGTRVVSIPQKLVDYLKTVKKSGIYVLTKSTGGMMTDTAWKRLWDSYLCDLNLKYGKQIDKRNKFDPQGQILTIDPFTPHCLRHTFCTIMYEAGIDVLTAKEQMGHSDIKTTLAIYTHLDKTYKQKNISKMDEYLNKNIGCF